MLTVSNIDLVNEIFNAKEPRPIRETMLEIYPDATEDANGRFHAPYDGYECQITGKTFRAGEYLPMNEPEAMDNYRVMGRVVHYPRAMDSNGNVHEWNGTRAQNSAVWSELIRQTREVQAANSDFIGEVGKFVETPIKITFHKAFDGLYGKVHLFIMEDANKNIIVYKGSSSLVKSGVSGVDWNKVYNITFNLRAKVKLHNVREGVKQTLVERPKFIS